MGKPLNEADVIRIIRRDGRYHINPLADRNRGPMKLLERMAESGLLTKRKFKPDWVEYYEAPLSKGQAVAIMRKWVSREDLMKMYAGAGLDCW